MNSTVRVVPFPSPVRALGSGSGSGSVVMYELRPPAPLPTLDLSLSLKSRFLSRPALNRLTNFVAKREAIGIAGFLGLTLYIVTVAVPVETGRFCAVAPALLWMPSMVASFSLLRYEIVKLFLTTCDFWFATIVNASTFLTLCGMIGDVRCLGVIAAWLGVQVTIMIDANLRAVKVWTALNIIGVLTHSTTWFAVSFMVIDRLRDFPVVHYRHHEYRRGHSSPVD